MYHQIIMHFEPGIAVITVEPAVKYSFVFKKYANELGSISAALSSLVFVLAHFPEQRLVIEPTNETNGPIQCEIDHFASFASQTANNTRLTLSPCLHDKPLTSVITCYNFVYNDTCIHVHNATLTFLLFLFALHQDRNILSMNQSYTYKESKHEKQQKQK